MKPKGSGFKEEKPLKGDILDLKVERLAQGSGKGVCKTEAGFIVFVPNVVSGDRIKARMTRIKKRFGEADLIEVIEPSVNRIKPLCPVFNSCGGCQWQMMDYSEQVNQKKGFLDYEFKKLGYLGSIDMNRSEKEFRYRNRIQVHQDGKDLGFYKKKSHSLVKIKDCLIAEEDLVEKFADLLKENVKKRRLEIAKDSLQKVHIYEGGKRPADLNMFSQVNTLQNNKMIGFIIEQLSTYDFESVFDLYSGNGNLTFPLAKAFNKAKITGVELSEISVKIANEDERKTSRVNFIASDVSKFLKNSSLKPDLILLDPPRDGAGLDVVEEVLKVKPRVLGYVSCDLATLVRDLKPMLEGYEIKTVSGFDMFPQTYHLETVVFLERK